MTRDEVLECLPGESLEYFRELGKPTDCDTCEQGERVWFVRLSSTGFVVVNKQLDPKEYAIHPENLRRPLYDWLCPECAAEWTSRDRLADCPACGTVGITPPRLIPEWSSLRERR
jgi:hypothetical protein